MWSERQRGFTLVEMILAIVILGVGLAGVLMAFQQTARASADPLVNRQLLALAEGLLEEALSKPYKVGAGTGGTCRANFDDVRDYNGYSAAPCEVGGGAVASLSSYNLAVAVSAQTLSGVNNALRVEVTASRGTDTLSLVGWRTDYAGP
ncbi:MSHA pilin protein MshD [Inhella inkyongensis]|uniref:MSHA pilin protein MshD n=1 Tax=Inhella inkyongensis TaxID=392593 RepID=A0A840S4X3_9BURK|nr:prepilin-type N-terminal cleavage/methylation domain-containing protein [Inhella inkyongensis]MBB5204602.1 MSHA pilin protein MshD [Inhella inkyongensis]